MKYMVIVSELCENNNVIVCSSSQAMTQEDAIKYIEHATKYLTLQNINHTAVLKRVKPDLLN